MSEDDHISVEPEAPSTMLALIDRYVRDPSIDVEKLERLWAIHREQTAALALEQFNEAMNAAQEEIQPVARTAENTSTRSWYAKLEEVDKAIRPIYLKHGFAVSYNTVPPLTEGNLRIECRCARAGHVERFYREAGPDTMGPKGTPTKTALHGAGSTETFLKRYIVCGIFNVVFKDMDDDGVGGPIDQVEYAYLRQLIAQVEALDSTRDEAALCRYMKIQKLTDMPKHALNKAVSTLTQKITELANRPEG